MKSIMCKFYKSPKICTNKTCCAEQVYDKMTNTWVCMSWRYYCTDLEQQLQVKDEMIDEAENILTEIAETIEVSYQQGKIDAVGYTCLDAKKVYNLLESYKS